MTSFKFNYRGEVIYSTDMPADLFEAEGLIPDIAEAHNIKNQDAITITK